jgi:hypothetical protein
MHALEVTEVKDKEIAPMEAEVEVERYFLVRVKCP